VETVLGQIDAEIARRRDGEPRPGPDGSVRRARPDSSTNTHAEPEQVQHDRDSELDL
jgi:hypothetical protein